MKRLLFLTMAAGWLGAAAIPASAAAPSISCSPSTGPTMVGVAWITNCTATGGTPPYVGFGLNPSNVIPAGLQITANGSVGTISGTPTQAGSYSFGIFVRDSTNTNSATVTFTGTIAPIPALTLTCNPATGPAKVGTPYATNCTAAGGSPPYAFGLNPANVIPAGLSIVQSAANVGTISGTPTVAGSYSFGVFVQDSRGFANSVTQSFSGTIAPLAAATLNAAPNSVSLSANAGTTAAVSTTVDVTASSGSLSFTAAASGGSWLSVSPTTGVTPQTLTIKANPTGLQAGNYTGTVTLTCSGASSCTPVSIAVSFGVQGVVITATPTVLNISVTQGQQQNAGITLGGATSISVGVASGGTWLSAPAAVTAPGTLTLGINAGNLAPGPYSGSAVLSCTSAPCVPITVTVNLTVTPGAPALVSSLNQVNLVTSIPVYVGATSGTLHFSVSITAISPAGGTWLTVTPTTGVTPQVLLFTADPEAFSPTGNNTATVTLACTGTPACSPITISVVGAPPVHPIIAATPNPVVVSVTQGQTKTANVTLSLISAFNVPPTSVSAGVVAGGGWLGLGNVPTSLPAPISVTVDATHLAPGSYTGSFLPTCTVQGTDCYPNPVPVQVNVTAAPTGALTLDQTSLSLTATGGTTTPVTGTVKVTSSGAFTTALIGSAPWLSVSSSAATGPATLTISADPSGLPSCNYNGTIGVASGGITNQIGVSLTVTAGAALTANLSALSFTAYQNRGNPPAKSVTVTASDGHPACFTLGGMPSWLSASALSGTSGQQSGTISMTPNAVGLAPSISSGNILVTASTSSGTPLILPASLIVSPFSVAANPLTLNVSVAPGKTQIATLGIATADGGPAVVNLAASGSAMLAIDNPSVTAPANANITVNAAGVAEGIYQGTITLTCSSGNPCAPVPVPVQITVTTSPRGPAVQPGGVGPVFSAATTIQPGSWVSIYGTNLAPALTLWNGDFPKELAGTSVTVNGKPAFLYFVSPTQINLQAPDDTTTGTVPVVVSTVNGTATSTVTLGPTGPSFSLLDAKHVAAIILRSDGSGAQGGGSYDVIGPTGTSLGYPTVPAKAGDTIVLFGVGFGPTSPALPAGKALTAGLFGTATDPIELTINGKTVTPSFAGITQAGLYQFNLVVPDGLGSGDVPLAATVDGVSTPAGIVISLQ